MQMKRLQEIDELARILIGDPSHFYRESHSVSLPDTGQGSE
jgi:hypothetical protein